MASNADASFSGPGDPPVPLVVSSYTLGTAVSLEERIRVAAAAGFDGIGLRAENYWEALEEGFDDVATAELAQQYGVGILEVEYVTGWGSMESRDPAQREKEKTVFHLARQFGVRHVNAGLLEELPIEVMTDAFRQLCDRAGDLIVALEFMPYSGVPDLVTAWQIVREAGAANGALIIDVWHWARAGTTAADLEDVPGDRIVAVQLSDVVEVPMSPLRSESLGHRLPPGQGYGDAVGVLRALKDKQVRPDVVAVEVISDDLVAEGVDVAARTCADAARAVLAAAAS